MPQAMPKANQISSELIDILASKNRISEMDFYRYIREIEKLRDFESEDYLKALANGAFGRKDEAVAFFEEAVKQDIDIVAQNYVVYLNDYGTHREVLNVVNRFAEKFRSRTMLGYAWETNLFMGDIDKAMYYAEIYAKSADEEEAEAMRHAAETALEKSNLFKRNSGLTDSEYSDIAYRVMDVVDSKGMNPIELDFAFIPEENISAYIMTVNTLDSDILSDMNLDIAFSLAENDDLLGKNFSVWFKGALFSEDIKNVCE
ncbi:hypothetical protein NUKP24_21040 [Klebsiella variicola]|uniref:hypothetical protein n=1 Tax=Klebsiella variicola TaxID=244366 RepID=UPI0021818DDA|nr:hypothetical protein [Klebsiella variicola]GKJ27968.1 hypothetical protein NUKP24_21040 [Klebsiella variicola]HCI9143658.1 hypothetical protein [Klebsiella variicola]